MAASSNAVALIPETVKASPTFPADTTKRTPARYAHQSSNRAKALKRGEVVEEEAPVVTEERRPATRQQPQRQSRKSPQM